MVTTIQNDPNSRSLHTNSPLTTLTLVLLLVLASFKANAKLDVSAVTSVETVYQDLKRQNEDTRTLTSVIVEPTLNLGYRSKVFRGLWKGTYTRLQRDTQDITFEQDYGEYSYSALWTPYDDLIAFSAQGTLQYQNTNTSNFLVTDYLNNANDLAKTRSNRFSSTINLDKGNWVRANGTASYSDTASERTDSSNRALDNDSYELNGNVFNGDRMRRVTWSITGAYQSTQQNTDNAGRFKSRNGIGFVDFNLFEQWAVRLTGQHEANQISGRNDTGSLVREYNSVGAGILYRQAENRYIALTMNKSYSDLDEDDDESFAGVEIGWALSSRTQFSAAYGRRFYGEAIKANLNYNTKNVRLALSYNEDVTNTSRLLANPENLGVFVCPATSTSIADCYQPNSLSYTPDVDEQLVQFTSQNLEFDDNIILRKSANFQSGYSFSRFTIAVSSRYSLDDYLDDDRLRRTLSLSSNLAYKIGSYTNLKATINYADIIDQGNVDIGRIESQNWNSSLGLTRELGKQLVADFDVIYLHQQRENISNERPGSNFADRRISASITYTFN
ncbi:hypothetical protein D210916BOD24_07810 [Alteromonas sp. D210916BOD_24]|uniref:TIGR03016 family PEP-CTERM system-associated outer membrane protein n=1 Tax=Alteromonas sp. D210916BOD_24 TaxID=3157618 RepID=UPI00399C6968